MLRTLPVSVSMDIHTPESRTSPPATFSLSGNCVRNLWIAAPFSTLDPDLASGAEIPIEERHPSEVTAFGGTRVAPKGVDVYNPAFDVTPAELVAAIITDAGVFRPPYEETLFGARS